ncbi:hypothetical protein TREMEDRAFT_59052 [Tremella mesenterica DSM 1558]|uniref:uncharacterized protein n=1 Tax=Tremella mesenterica (strain ATCC 24925 / CBS 8224 / DSM 1558 / NBRC 9311 / NRRL Y-6157 / RJB 2259-6 / UBC 559-6) TaxID=578456 RepID=UPI0003F49E9A|nr:uncharacterized protein TREMEDRAFT_59052 [Tremella mesenterica DSM 1558]EIW72890.1 hypothetical protein TREMEDRAFT_59052 [Tremella mesenterica DSM 1558]
MSTPRSNPPPAADRIDYRPLNVRDALTYLDQVKNQFADHPDVYNRFLDIMKEFKGQIIDTPGVIDRVSTLFRGHPALIQGFNTFLPPGYRIEASTADDDSGKITVTTPSGTVSQMPGALSAAIHQRYREGIAVNRTSPSMHETAPPGPSQIVDPLPPLHSHLSSGPPPFQNTHNARGAPVVPGLPPAQPSVTTRPLNNVQSAPGPLPLPPHTQPPSAPSGPSTPSAVQFLASGASGPGAAAQAGQRGQMLEFNHAISFVNKIKNRFNQEHDTYKQFLEILQTYQRDTRDIVEVYEQVQKLFINAPDLLTEFKQFLPENGQGGLLGLGNAALGGPAPPSAERPVPPKRASKENKDSSAQKKRRTGPADVSKPTQKRSKHAAKVDSPSEDMDGSFPTNQPQTLASAEEVAFFDKVKKFIDDKDMIDPKTLLDRAETFLGGSGDVWTNFKRMIGVDDTGNVPPTAGSAQGGYNFGGMLNIDQQVVENTPMLDRVKPDMSSSRAKTYGPSYRKLPKTVNLQCSGRDAMCWEVLNDEWVSHPTWAAEDAAPFMAHKKNAYEEALHKSEEERHEYDYHIEANLRTIALLEPLKAKIDAMDAEEKAHFNLKAGLGGQSKSIYQRIIKKVYGKELGPDIIKALHENPVTALPIVLDRLRAKDEEWKKAQREWNRVWREQDARNFYKALDHQAAIFKANDKKLMAPKSLITEIETRRREQTNARAALLNPSVDKARPQFEFLFDDVEVIKDIVKLIIIYLDRANSSSNHGDRTRVEMQIRRLIPHLFLLNREEFEAELNDPESSTSDSDSDQSSEQEAEDDDGMDTTTLKSKKQADDLRKQLFKGVDKDGREKSVTATPAPDDGVVNGIARSTEGTPMTDNERGDTPPPAAADPQAVAEAIKKDKVGAEASEQIWVQIETGDSSSQASSPHGSETYKTRVIRKANFFGNANFYVLVRLLQILYSRLKACKTYAEKAAMEQKATPNPVAVEMGLADPESTNFGVEAGENPARYFYGHLLSMAEKLFDAEIDTNTFEETLRIMFQTQAYTMFTLDRLLGSIVKQAQTIIGDIKSQELFSLLERDREQERTSTRQQIAYRMSAEGLLAADENLFRMEWLMGRDDLTVYDAETVTARWRQYVDSYVLTHPTEGQPIRVSGPFLSKGFETTSEDVVSSQLEGRSGLELKLALGNLRMFFTPGTEDYYYRRRPDFENNKLDTKEIELESSHKAKLDQWVEKMYTGSEMQVEPAVVA